MGLWFLSMRYGFCNCFDHNNHFLKIKLYFFEESFIFLYMNLKSFIVRCKKDFPNYIRGMTFVPVGDTTQCVYVTSVTRTPIILASLENGSFIIW